MDDPIRCNFLHCYAGMGVAGNRHCFLGGDYRDAECPKYINEEEKLREMEKIDSQNEHWWIGDRYGHKEDI